MGFAPYMELICYDVFCVMCNEISSLPEFWERERHVDGLGWP
jgi:hypothetical protein